MFLTHAFQPRRTFLKRHFTQTTSAIALALALAACGTRGPQAPEPAVAYTSANTLVLPAIAYGKTAAGITLTAADDGCDIPGTITAALKDNLSKPYEYLNAGNAKDIPGVQTLTIEIIDILANGGGIFSGPKMVEIKGILSRAGADPVSFKARRVSFPVFPPRSTCNIVGRNTEALGADVAQWLTKPVNGAVLGDH